MAGRLLEHASACAAPACRTPACQALKLLIRHEAECPVRRPGACRQCDLFWRITAAHAHGCADKDCAVPHCAIARACLCSEALLRLADEAATPHRPLTLQDVDQ